MVIGNDSGRALIDFDAEPPIEIEVSSANNLHIKFFFDQFAARRAHGFAPRFVLQSGETTVHHNGAKLPRVPMIQRLVRRARQRRPRLGYLIDRLNLRNAPYPPMSTETRRRLLDTFEPELAELQQRWNIDTRPWRGGQIIAPAASTAATLGTNSMSSLG